MAETIWSKGDKNIILSFDESNSKVDFSVFVVSFSDGDRQYCKTYRTNEAFSYDEVKTEMCNALCGCLSFDDACSRTNMFLDSDYATDRIVQVSTKGGFDENEMGVYLISKSEKDLRWIADFLRNDGNCSLFWVLECYKRHCNDACPSYVQLYGTILNIEDINQHRYGWYDLSDIYVSEANDSLYVLKMPNMVKFPNWWK